MMPLMTAQVRSETPETLKEIEVTATPPDAPERIVSETLAGGGDLKDILRFEPNVQLGSAPSSIFSLRGNSQEGTAMAGTRSNPAVNVLYGGAPRTTNTLWVLGAPTWDSSVVEVEAGPILFGTGPVSRGGEIRIIPNVPVFTHEGRLLAEMAEYDSFRLGLTENVVLMDEKLALRMNLSSEGTDGSVTNVTRDDDAYNGNRIDFVRGQLRWRPAGNDEAVFDLLVESERARGNSLGFANETGDTDLFDRRNFYNAHEGVPGERDAVVFNGRVELGGGKWIEGELTYQGSEGYQRADLDGGPLLNWFYQLTADEEVFTGGVRFHRETAGMNVMFGVFAESARYLTDFTGVGRLPFPTGSRFSNQLEENLSMLAMFGRLEYEMTRNWWIAGGVRLDYQHREQSSRGTFAGMPVGSGDKFEAEGTEWLPELGIEWRENGSRIGAKITRAYRPPGLAYASTLVTSSPYDAEQGWEGTVFAEKAWDRFRIESRLFYSKLKDQQVSYVAPGGVTLLDQFITNSGESTRGGAEIEMQWRMAGSLVAGLSAGYLYTNYDKLVLNGIDRSDMAFPAAPELTTAVQLGWLPATGVFGETLLTWADTSYSQPQSPEATALEKRLQLSARIGYRWDRAEVYVFGTNLLNEDFALVRQDNTSIGRRIDGQPSMPRTFGAGLSFTW